MTARMPGGETHGATAERPTHETTTRQGERMTVTGGAEASAASRQTIVIEVVKGPSKGKVYRAGPNQNQLSVGRTKASLVHVKSPGVSEKHAEVSEIPRRAPIPPTLASQSSI